MFDAADVLLVISVIRRFVELHIDCDPHATNRSSAYVLFLFDVCVMILYDPVDA